MHNFKGASPPHADHHKSSSTNWHGARVDLATDAQGITCGGSRGLLLRASALVSSPCCFFLLRPSLHLAVPCPRAQRPQLKNRETPLLLLPRGLERERYALCLIIHICTAGASSKGATEPPSRKYFCFPSTISCPLQDHTKVLL